VGDFFLATDRETLLKTWLPELIFYALQPDLDKMTISNSEIIKMASPDSIDWQIRTRIDELILKISPRTKKETPLEEFYEGICDERTFKKRLKHEWKRSFITRPLNEFAEGTDHIISSLTARFYEIASLPISSLDSRGNKTVDMKNAKLMMDLAKLMLDRKFGAAFQRNLNLTANAPPPPPPLPPPLSPEKPVTVDLAQIESEILALEAEFEPTPAIPKVASGEEKKEEGKGDREGASPVPG
jgi:hypothetical protein